MAEEYNKSHDNEYERKVGDYEEGSGAAPPAETKDRGLFDFLGKKEEEKPQHHEEEVIVTEFDKVKVSEKEEKKHESLSDKLHRSDSSSSSSSDEEEGLGEEKKKKKKDKKGLKEKIQEKVSGDHKEEDTSVPVEKYHVEPHHEDVPVVAVGHDYPEEKKGFLEKIKDKLPGQHKKTEEVPASSPPSYEHEHQAAAAAAAEPTHEASESSPKEKKGILEKIKEKLPGYHPKTEEEKEIKEKEKETPSY